MKNRLRLLLGAMAFASLPTCASAAKSAPASSAVPGACRLRYFMQAKSAPASSTPYGDNRAAGAFVRSGDARIYYEAYGSGEPIFVLHGGGVGSPYELGRLIDRLRETGRRVIVMTSRGHGRSEIGRSGVSLEGKARDLLAVMRAETQRPAAVLGFSDGAYTALKAAGLAPGALERVVAIGAGTLRPGYYSSEIRVEDLERRDRAYFEQQRRLMPEPGRLQEFLSDYMAFWSRASIGREFFGAVRCPALLVTGDEDDHAPVKTVLEAHQMMPNSSLAVVPKAWHTAFLDNFDSVWAAVSPFLEAKASDLKGSRKVAAND